MNRMQARGMTLAVAALAISWGGAARGQEAGKKAGEKLDQVGRELKGTFKRAGESAREQFARAKTSVQAMGVESRVYGRIHWDKALNDALIELSATGEGVVTLDGTVADAKAKKRAVELAEETVGVSRVVDRLAIRPPATPRPLRGPGGILELRDGGPSRRPSVGPSLIPMRSKWRSTQPTMELTTSASSRPASVRP